MTNKDITLSVFFPAYYDEKNIGKVVHQAVKVLEELQLKDYEITIIEDGSPDNTAQVADELAKQNEKVNVIHHKKNLGYGATLKEGFKTAKLDYVFYTDGDNQFDIEELKKFVALIPYSDIVVGYRKKKQYSTYRKLTSFIYNFVLRFYFDIDFVDIDCAFKLFKRDLFDRITIKTKDAFIDAEIMIQAKLLGYTSTEVGVKHLPRIDGISTAARPQIIIRTIKEIIHVQKRAKGIKMNNGSDKAQKTYTDLKDVVIIFSVLIVIIVLASLFDFFEELNKLAQNPEGFKIVELLFVLFLFASAYAVFIRRRWKESHKQIGQREKQLEELNDNVNRLRSTVDLSPDAIIIHRQGVVLFVNKAGVHLFGGLTEEDILGKHIKELIHYSFVDKVFQRIEQMTKYMKQVPVLDITIKKINGTYLEVSVASTPVYFHAIPHIITILRDITDRKKNEELKSQLASIILHTTDSVYALSLDGMILSWNPGAEMLYGYSRREAVGNHISFIYPQDKKNEINYLLDKINKDESVVGYETKRIKKDGTIMDVSITVSPIKEASGIITGASTIARDITFKKQVEAELRRYAEELALSNEELYVFSYAASHDLQEPLRTIQAFIQLLNEKHKKKLSPEVDELIDSAEDGVTRMHRLITDFLMYSRVGSQSAVIETVDCNAVLNDALDNLKIAIKESKSKIKHYSLPNLRGNKVQLTQVFQNLISNAIKYKGEKKPAIEISAEKTGEFWKFAVKDNGIGIEEWFSERIFIVFQKLHDHKRYPGSGIGLALCKRVIEKHGGKIWFESEVGKGTTFYFTMPEANEEKND